MPQGIVENNRAIGQQLAEANSQVFYQLRHLRGGEEAVKQSPGKTIVLSGRAERAQAYAF